MFLRPLAGNANLTVVTDALVTAVTLENGAASGLAYTASDGQSHAATAKPK
ncbi:hypothetical protein ACVDG5_015650 [Mesorhizobium sp. ORM6]